jgi:hypothetical protein
MSAFTIEHARQFADNAFRFRPDKFGTADKQKRSGEAHRPLVGKEEALLGALLAGEQRYEWCKEEISAIRKLRRSDAQVLHWCTNTAKELRKILESLDSLDPLSLDELDRISETQVRQDFEKTLSWAQEGAEELFPKAPKGAGRKPGVGKRNVELVPLEEFAKEIRIFLQEAGLSFSFDAITRHDLDPVAREPISVAARLLYDATRVLDARIELCNVEAIMRAVKRNPRFRTELLGDPAVDAITS